MNKTLTLNLATLLAHDAMVRKTTADDGTADITLFDNEQTSQMYSLRSAFACLNDAHALYDAASHVVSFLLEAPSVKSFSLDLEITGEYNDQGGTFDSPSVRITDIVLFDGVDEDELDESDEHPETIADGWGDDCGHLPHAFLDGQGEVSIAINADSDEVKALLQQPEISGREALRLLMPTWHELAEEKVAEATRRLSPQS